MPIILAFCLAGAFLGYDEPGLDSQSHPKSPEEEKKLNELMLALKDTNQKIRVDAIWALVDVKSKSETVVVVLRELLKKDADPEIRWMAVVALRSMKEKAK